VQYSIFEAFLGRVLFDNLVEDVKTIIDPGEDGVTIYPLCAVCAEKRIRLGIDGNKVSPGEETVFIV